MERYSLQEAQDDLQKLIHDALHGKTVLIMDADEQTVQLIPVIPSTKPRKAGSARGQVHLADNFDAPLVAT